MQEFRADTVGYSEFYIEMMQVMTHSEVSDQ
jgi:hypothetical protein